MGSLGNIDPDVISWPCNSQSYRGDLISPGHGLVTFYPRHPVNDPDAYKRHTIARDPSLPSVLSRYYQVAEVVTSNGGPPVELWLTAITENMFQLRIDVTNSEPSPMDLIQIVGPIIFVHTSDNSPPTNTFVYFTPLIEYIYSTFTTFITFSVDSQTAVSIRKAYMESVESDRATIFLQNTNVSIFSNSLYLGGDLYLPTTSRGVEVSHLSAGDHEEHFLDTESEGQYGQIYYKHAFSQGKFHYFYVSLPPRITLVLESLLGETISLKSEVSKPCSTLIVVCGSSKEDYIIKLDAKVYKHGTFDGKLDFPPSIISLSNIVKFLEPTQFVLRNGFDSSESDTERRSKRIDSPYVGRRAWEGRRSITPQDTDSDSDDSDVSHRSIPSSASSALVFGVLTSHPIFTERAEFMVMLSSVDSPLITELREQLSSCREQFGNTFFIDVFQKLLLQVDSSVGNFPELLACFNGVKFQSFILALCPICCSDGPMISTSLPCCNAVACINCFRTHLQTQITLYAPGLKCFNCGSSVSRRDLESRVDPDFTRHQLMPHLVKMGLAGTSLEMCPNCNHITQKPKKKYTVVCPVCELEWCYNCRAPQHKGMSCGVYRHGEKDLRKWARAMDNKEDEDKLQRNAVQCPKCRIFVSRNDGCPHMVCRCGKEFCYNCGGHFWKYHQSKFSPWPCTALWPSVAWARAWSTFVFLVLPIGFTVLLAIVLALAAGALAVGAVLGVIALVVVIFAGPVKLAIYLWRKYPTCCKCETHAEEFPRRDRESVRADIEMNLHHRVLNAHSCELSDIPESFSFRSLSVISDSTSTSVSVGEEVHRDTNPVEYLRVYLPKKVAETTAQCSSEEPPPLEIMMNYAETDLEVHVSSNKLPDCPRIAARLKRGDLITPKTSSIVGRAHSDRTVLQMRPLLQPLGDHCCSTSCLPESGKHDGQPSCAAENTDEAVQLSISTPAETADSTSCHVEIV